MFSLQKDYFTCLPQHSLKNYYKYLCRFTYILLDLFKCDLRYLMSWSLKSSKIKTCSRDVNEYWYSGTRSESGYQNGICVFLYSSRGCQVYVYILYIACLPLVLTVFLLSSNTWITWKTRESFENRTLTAITCHNPQLYLIRNSFHFKKSTDAYHKT